MFSGEHPIAELQNGAIIANCNGRNQTESHEVNGNGTSEQQKQEEQQSNNSSNASPSKRKPSQDADTGSESTPQKRLKENDAGTGESSVNGAAAEKEVNGDMVNDQEEMLVTVKTEPLEETQQKDDEGQEQPDNASSTSDAVKVKTEPSEEEHRDEEEQPSCSNVSASYRGTADIKPAVKVEKAEASSSADANLRPSCYNGIRCYRRNPVHRAEEAHPGDPDYRRPNYPPPPPGTPPCPYGHRCYRRNPIHFQSFSHPDADFDKNYKNYRMRLRQRNRQQGKRQQNGDLGIDDDDASDLDEYDLEDPFLDDSGDDYMPSSGDEDDDDEEESELNNNDGAEDDDGDQVEE